MSESRIHKGNYEEYFLLYVDQELSAADQEAVDAFVLLHPELKIELDMLMDAKLSFEPIEFDAKTTLYKIEDSSIEEWQLLSIDHELSEAQELALADFHRTHPQALAAFDVLIQTTLPAETIVYPHKETLYKRAATVRPLTWFTVAAAAAVLLLMFLLNKSELETETIIPEKIVAKVENNVTNDAPYRTTEKTPETKEIDQPKTASTPVVEQSTISEKVIIEAPKETPSNPVMVAVEPIRVTTAEPIVAASLNEMPTPSIAAPIKADYAMEALTETLPTEQEEPNKKGLRGFVRKASRIYQKITQPDDEKLSIQFARLK